MYSGVRRGESTRLFDVVFEVWNLGKRLRKMPPEVYDELESVPPEDTAECLALQGGEPQRPLQCELQDGDLVLVLTLHILPAAQRRLIPPHLSHIGDDLSWGLFIFVEKKLLGARGFDKTNFDVQVAFTEAHLEDIYDSAWWQGADDPWQCLTMCQEVYSAIESGDPEVTMRRWVGNQDVQQANLSMGERPSDVYSFVGGMVKKMLEDVSHKVVKQTVMTTVYGVTFVSTRDRIEKQLKNQKDLPEEECWLAVAYLVKKIRQRKMRKNTLIKMVSLPDLRLKKEQVTSMVWTTPLGLPICQPYRKMMCRQIFTAIQTVFVITDPAALAEVNTLTMHAHPPRSASCGMKSARAPVERAAGQVAACGESRIYASEAEVPSQHAIADLVEVSDTVAPMLEMKKVAGARGDEEESGVDAGVEAEAMPPKPKRRQRTKKMMQMAAADAAKELRRLVAKLDTTLQMELAEDALTKAWAELKKKQEELELAQLMGKFVNLTDLLPLLPQNGGFEVGASSICSTFSHRAAPSDIRCLTHICGITEGMKTACALINVGKAVGTEPKAHMSQALP
ncbi:hypothetical protein B0H11DRAFT_2260040 [Mycena galericulata]|nr:hypothetical protein B0H11DRAFT_2260040 [Mycena galericulata]